MRFLVPSLGPEEAPKKSDSTDTVQKNADLGKPSKDDSASAKPAQAEDKIETDASDEKTFHGPGGSRVVVTPTTISFKGYSTIKHTLYDVKLKLAREVDPSSATCIIGEGLSTTTVEVNKKELDASYWKTLVEAKKLGYLRTDFEMVWNCSSGGRPFQALALPTSNESYSGVMKMNRNP